MRSILATTVALALATRAHVLVWTRELLWRREGSLDAARAEWAARAGAELVEESFCAGRGTLAACAPRSAFRNDNGPPET